MGRDGGIIMIKIYTPKSSFSLSIFAKSFFFPKVFEGVGGWVFFCYLYCSPSMLISIGIGKLLKIMGYLISRKNYEFDQSSKYRIFKLSFIGFRNLDIGMLESVSVIRS